MRRCSYGRTIILVLGWLAIVGAFARLLVQAQDSIDGVAQWLPWVGVAALGVLGMAVVLLVSRLLSTQAAMNAELDRVARVDPLTGLRNRREINDVLVGLLSAARRHELDLSVLVVDVDHFKTVNDDYGHQAGDLVLRDVARGLADTLRAEDAVGRWGGEEFLVALTGIDEAGALTTAERLRRRVAESPCRLPDGRLVSATVTIGASTWRGQGLEDLVREADEALYAGKAAGRDTVRVSA